MQSGSGGGPSRTPGMAHSTSSAPSPSPSQSPVSTPQQNQQQQQSLQRPPSSEGKEAFTNQPGGIQGIMAGSSFSSPGSVQMPQHSRNFFELAQQQGPAQDSQRVEQQMLTPIQQTYLQYSHHFQRQPSTSVSQQQVQMGADPASNMNKDMQIGNLNMQQLISLRAAGQAQGQSLNTSSMNHEEQPAADHKNEPKSLPQQVLRGQLMPANMMRSSTAPQAQSGIQNVATKQLASAAQWQAVQAWALERNIDLSNPANANLLEQLLSHMQSRSNTPKKENDGVISAHLSSFQVSKQHAGSQLLPCESQSHAILSSDKCAQSGSAKAIQTVQPSPFGATSISKMVNNANNIPLQRPSVLAPSRPLVMTGNGMAHMHALQTSACASAAVDNSLSANCSAGLGTQLQQLHRGFTKQQFYVLKAQILALRRLKKGESTLPQELLQAIIPPPLELQLQQQFFPTGVNGHNRPAEKIVREQEMHLESNRKDAPPMSSFSGHNIPKEEANVRDDKATVTSHVNGIPPAMKESVSVAPGSEEQQTALFALDQEVNDVPETSTRSDYTADKGKAPTMQVAVADAGQVKKSIEASNLPQPKDVESARNYRGPLFDFPFFTRKHDASGSAMPNNINNNNNLTLSNVKDLLFEEGVDVTNKKRSQNLKKISGLLAVNLERKRIMPDLVLRLQIEEKKIRLVDLQARLREEVDQQQMEIMAMPDRPYRKFVRLCECQRAELERQVHTNQRAFKEKQLKSVIQWRKKLLEAHWAIRDSRAVRNRGVAKYHEKMLKEFSKTKDENRNKRMEALKNNDVERYREMLLEQQTDLPGDAADRYSVLSSFLSQTEEYLHKLGSKIKATKNQQEVDEAANAASASARLQGLSEEEVRAAAVCAGDEVIIRNQFTEMNAPKAGSSVNKYYNLAHAVNESVLKQPSMLRAGTLRDYQLVGLQWMLSLYNNKLNGILADEMGLGKTVQVMALIAYLMEFKGEYGPHLIIVPNAVLVNWKSEFLNWLPTCSCIFYVGTKDQRTRLFSQEVSAVKFNVLVTTYEFIMFDRSKLSKIDWKYIIIDEAQRMKDRESVLARDLDKYHCQRRLLLTGTPLQNDLKELWSLLNLLLPDVFDNRKLFHDWFSQPFQKEVPGHNVEDDWLETEKKVIVIHRLHQILEPFMLRRRVEDVEGSLPPKVSIVLRCRMSAIQSAIYDWIKATGSIRTDPEDEKRRTERSLIYQAQTYRTLTNRCTELRKVCNHPLLNYPYFNDFSKDFLVKSCGKLWLLDRILVKLHRTGHRVLLFSTMTKLLDIFEEYLEWRQLVYRRIDGTTSLDDRESAILDFNNRNSDCFIFLLSIRAAGRGLNLQSADTVIIYDPDPNPKNEEQAVARAHRIGQTREVKVIYMEAVVDKIPSHQKEDELRSCGSVDLEDELAGKDRYMGSIESLIRKNIQQYKIEMADEVINAGRFDQRTTHEERRMTLETLLHDEERYQETVHDVPSLHTVNRMIARSDEEVAIFDQMDEEFEWMDEMTSFEQVPKWLRASSREVNAAVARLSKKPSKNGLDTSSAGIKPDESGTRRKRGRPKGRKQPNYKEIDNENEEYSEATSDEKNPNHVSEEGRENGDDDDDESCGDIEALPMNKDQPEDDSPVCDGGYDHPQVPECTRHSHTEESRYSGSSAGNQRLTQMASHASQKFGSLSVIDIQPGSSIPRRLPGKVEVRETATFGDSYLGHQRPGSWVQDRDEADNKQVLQPKVKGKRSIRPRPLHNVDRPYRTYMMRIPSLGLQEPSVSPLQVNHTYQRPLRSHGETKLSGESDVSKHMLNSKPILRSGSIANTSKLHASPKSVRSNCVPTPEEDDSETYKVSRDGNGLDGVGASSLGAKFPDLIQRRCKNVISKLQRRIVKEGQEIVPLLTDLWKRIENSGYPNVGGTNLLDLRIIDYRVDRLEYAEPEEFVSDVQLMLKGAMQFYGFSQEVRTEANKVSNLFFDLMKIVFPHTDFRKAQNALSSSGQLTSPRHSNRENPMTERVPNRSQEKLKQPSEGSRIRVQIPRKETRVSSGNQSSKERDKSPLLAHPGDLVICKKKRKDREKTKTEPVVSVSHPLRNSDTISNNQQLRINVGGDLVGWANPVKKLRTDVGKRRPSHL